jgi:hypothetical protein
VEFYALWQEEGIFEIRIFKKKKDMFGTGNIHIYRMFITDFPLE